MIYETELLRPWRQLLIISLVPIVLVYSFLLWVFLSGQTGRYEYKTALAVEFGVPWEWITLLIIILIVIVYVLLRLFFSNASDLIGTLSIKGDVIEVNESEKKLIFNINSAEKTKYKSSWIWTRVFLRKFYCAGKLYIKYEGKAYAFFIKVINNGTEDQLNSTFNR